MKEFIKQKLHEHWGWDEPKVETPLSKELEAIENSGYDIYQIQQALEDLENSMLLSMPNMKVIVMGLLMLLKG